MRKNEIFVRILQIAACVLVVVIACIASYYKGVNNTYDELNAIESEYAENTETLLDSMYNWNEPFVQKVMTTDAYHNYEDARTNYIGE